MSLGAVSVDQDLVQIVCAACRVADAFYRFSRHLCDAECMLEIRVRSCCSCNNVYALDEVVSF